MEARAPLRLVLLLLCFFPALLHRFVVSTEAAPTLVTSLPGFAGVLPFRLETGYVTVDEENGAELFYYFIESEGDPRRDPLVLWLTGGDRCAVLSALFFEIGPLKFIIEPYNQNGTVPRLRYHPYSWTKAASILFVDSPVGAGFSFSRNPKGYDVGDVSSSLQLNKFLAKGTANYIPKSLLNFMSMCLRMINLKTIKEHCPAGDYDNSKNVLCAQAMEKFNQFYNQINKPHILYKKCFYVSPRPNGRTTERKILKEETGVLKSPPPRPSMDCQNYGNYLSYFWANNNITRKTLGIKQGSKEEWVRCHNRDLPYSSDIKSSIKYHRNMTTKGYRALVYSGDHDAVIPFLGTQSWVRSLNFLIVDEWRAWHLDGQSAGVVDTLRQSTNQRGASLCSVIGFLANHFD